MPFVRTHRLFLALTGVGALIRIIAVLGYHPALWFSDSLRYARFGVYVYPDIMRPSGYPLLLLYPLHWFHSFMLVVIVQHILGVATGVILYVVLLRRGTRRWGAALAAAPVLLSAYQIQIEHFILSDSLFIGMLVAAIAALLWNPSPGWLACAAGGLLLGGAVTVRSEGLPLLAAPVLWLAIQRSPAWHRACALAVLCAAFALPVVAYASWFHQSYGQYELTYSQGPFLAARAETFANCAADNIPRDERWLCTKPGRLPDWYLWTTHEPLHISGPGCPEGQCEFSRTTDKTATAFALHVIEAQPVEYVMTTWNDVLQNFTAGHTWQPFAFPSSTPPSMRQFLAANPGNPGAPIYAYDSHPSAQLSQPWAAIVQAYQRVMVVPPVATALLVLAGLAGLALCGQPRHGPGLLPWLIGVILLVFPAGTSGFGARYELAAIAPFCIAAALGLAEITGTESIVPTTTTLGDRDDGSRSNGGAPPAEVPAGRPAGSVSAPGRARPRQAGLERS